MVEEKEDEKKMEKITGKGLLGKVFGWWNRVRFKQNDKRVDQGHQKKCEDFSSFFIWDGCWGSSLLMLIQGKIFSLLLLNKNC